ncbi:MAG: phytanoyl-CoA dioxygenase family protein [bacterium]
MIITPIIKQLATKLQLNTKTNSSSDTDVIKLISEVKESLKTNSSSTNLKKLVSVRRAEKYPLDRDGYAIAFDPLADEASLVDTWSKFGVVVIKNVISVHQCDATIARMNEVVKLMSNGVCELNNADSWNAIPVDDAGTPFISRGFFELYHDDILAQIRQSVIHYLAQVLIWNRYDIWTSFDRLGVKLPHHAESKALSLHVDQNPLIHPDFRTVQGVLALVDCPVERGTFVAAIGSRNHFLDYKPHVPNKGEYVELPESLAGVSWIDKQLQAFPLRKGDLVLWDSRTTHANTENISQDIRYVAYTAAGPACETDHTLVNARHEAFRSGIGSNNREALMHASKKPRYTNPKMLEEVRKPEQLSLLGKLMYGIESYEKNIT